MRRLSWLGISILLAAGLFGQEFKLGSKVGDFTIYDLKGSPVQFSSLRGDVTVLMFIATQCPVSNGYNERMKAVYNDYSAKGVKFVVMNANRTEPAAEVERHAAQHGFPFKVYKDNNNVVADRFGAQVTPETFVLDRSGTILYHGYIDDSQNPAGIKVQGLRLALDAVLAGRPVERAETKAFGCAIKRARSL
jgi:peroxiredoxin